MRTSLRRLPFPLLLPLFLLLLAPAPAALSGERPPGWGLSEIPDPELADMRGRFTIGGSAVAWFGVSMISTWHTADGQILEGTLLLGMDFSQGGRPRISFTPTVNITHGDALPTAGDATGRSVDGSGLANVSGLTQAVQIAGAGNSAGNSTTLRVRTGDAPPLPPGATEAGNASQQAGAAFAQSGFDGASAGVLLQIQGQGEVQQWIRNGSLGQTIQVTADNQRLSNRLEIDLVRQPLAASATLTQNVSQALGQLRGIGSGY